MNTCFYQNRYVINFVHYPYMICFSLSVECELSDSRFQVPPNFVKPEMRQVEGSKGTIDFRCQIILHLKDVTDVTVSLLVSVLWPIRRKCSRLAGDSSAMHSYAIDAALSYSMQERNLKSHLNPIVCNSLPRCKATRTQPLSDCWTDWISSQTLNHLQR